MAANTTTALLTPRLTATTAAEGATARPPLNEIASLTRGLAAGEERAFCAFHRQYFDRLYQFLLVVSQGREHEAQEALQQTLLRVVHYAKVFDSEDAFWCWLKVLARSAARDAGRKQHRYLALLERFALNSQLDGESRQAGEEALPHVLEEALEELDAADRRLIEGKYVEGLTVKELAEYAGLTDKAIESRLLRVRQQLRRRTLEKLHRS